MNPAISELGAEEIWKEPVDRLLARLVTTAAGLDATEVQSRLKTFGPNDAAVVKRVTALVAISFPFPQSARHHPARGERAVGGDRRRRELR